MNRSRNRRRKRIKTKELNIIKILIILVILIFIIPRFISFAIYVYNFTYEHIISSQDFHFSSDKLTEDHLEYEVTNNWSGAETYTILINMSSKQNDMSYTEADIVYSISCTCSDNVTYTLSKTTGTIVGTKNNGDNLDAFTIDITPISPLSNNDEAWIEVTATSTAPYTKVLTGKMILGVGTSDISYEIIDAPNQPFLTVNIVNSTSIDTDVTLTYDPEVVLLDMTSRLYLNSTDSDTQQLNSYDYLNSITSSVSSLSTTSVKFYKIDVTQDYSYAGQNSITPVIQLHV